MANFSVLSWNIASGGPSTRAPASVDRQANLHRILDEIEAHDPDFICLQEMPSRTFTDHLSNTHMPGQVVKTHAGFTTIFTRKGRIAGQPIELESQLTLPPLAGMSLHVGDHFLIIFSVHLPPYKKNADHRRGILANLIKQLNPTQPLILAGDMNMRERETNAILKQGVLDAYREVDDPDRKRYATWASTLNKFHNTNHPFIARFDRIFVNELRVDSYQLVGNSPQLGPDHFLSDHFGILAEFSFM